MDNQETASTTRQAGVAADKLWQYQLRKENKALLEQLQENERRRQFYEAEADKKAKECADSIIALETKISEHEREKTRIDRAVKDMEMGQKTFKSGMMNFLQGRNPEGWSD